MPITWLHNNHESLCSDLTDNPLIQKFKSLDEEDGRESYNVIATNKHIASQLLRSFSKLSDAFPNLNLRLGWMNNGITDYDYDTMEIRQEDTIVIGEGTMSNQFMKIGGVKSLVLSNRTQNEYPHLGFQRHFSDHKNPDSISLGEMRADLSGSETMIRRAENIFFHLDVMRKEDSQSEQSHTAGIDIYVACKLMRLAGLSTNLNLICINTGSDQISRDTSDMISLLVWYFFEGQINKQIETMKQKENDIYLVSTEMFAEPIKFVVGHKTGRWWYQHPSTKEYIPCSDKDFQAIAVGDLPDSLVSLQN